MPRILIIDDQEAIRKALVRILEAAGHSVIQAEDGRQAWSLLDRAAVDLIITDVYMPEMDGIEFLVRLQDRAGAVPVIAMSGGGYAPSGFVLEDAKQLGASVTLEKPFSGQGVLSAVREALGGAAGADGVEGRA